MSGIVWQVDKSNRDLPIEQRVANMEEDMIAATGLIEELCFRCKEESERREKYDAFLDHLIEKAEYEKKFWREAGMKLVVSGVWTAIALIASACVFTLKEWLSK